MLAEVEGMIDAMEAIANSTIGLVISCVAVWAVFPLFGWHVSAAQSVAVTGMFWALSTVRCYLVRKAFKWLGR